MNIWKRFGKDYQKFIGSNDYATNLSSENIYLTINNKEVSNINFCSIDGINYVEQQSFAEKYLNSNNVTIYSSEVAQHSISSWGPKYNLKLHSFYPFFKKEGILENVSSPKIPLEIKVIKEQSQFKDMVDIYEKKFPENKNNFSKMFSSKILEDPSVNIFIAYSNDIPVSTVCTISYDEASTIWGSITDNDYINSGVMTNLMDYAIKYDIKNLNIKSHYGIVISEQFSDMCLENGATLIDRCYMWIKDGDQ